MSEDRAAEIKAAQEKADAVNKGRSGVGTRLFVGSTRGKGSMVISFEQFDDSEPDTLPKSTEEFMQVTGVTSESDILKLLIEGYNDKLYKDASDPLAEYVNAVWPADAQAQYRLIVRTTAKALGDPLDEVAEAVQARFNKKYAPAAPAA